MPLYYHLLPYTLLLSVFFCPADAKAGPSSFEGTKPAFCIGYRIVDDSKKPVPYLGPLVL